MRLAIIGTGPMAERLATLVTGAHEVLRIAAPAGAGAEERLSELATALGAGGAAAAVAATGEDERSLVAAAMARRLGALRSAAVVESPSLAAREDLATGLGIDRVIHPDAEVAAAVLAIVEGPAVSAIRSLGQGRIRVWEATIRPGWAGAGSSLRDLSLPAGSRIALIRRGERAMAPGAATALQAGDRVLLAANRAVADAAAERLGVEPRPATRALVAGPQAMSERVLNLTRLLRDAGLEAEAGPPARASGVTVVLRRAGAEDGATIEVSDDGPTDVVAARELARAALELLPRTPVERVGGILPGEMDVYRAEAGDHGDWLGRPLREVPALRGWIVLAIQASAGRNVHLPHPDDAIEPREVLIVAGPTGAEDVLWRGLRGGLPVGARA